MNSAQLLSHFDRLSDAPDAIPRLRRFILDLAVRGKLVEQDSRDEPSSELLKRIQEERRRHRTDGTVRKKAASQIDASEMPFDLPESWVRSSLGEVASYGLPEKVDSNKAISANTWVLDLEDIEKETSRLVGRVLSSSRPFQSSKTRFNKGDVLFGKLRPYLNKVLVADTDGVCTTEIIPVRGFGGIAPEYIRLVLKSPLTMKRIDRLMYGMKMPRLGTDDALRLNFPLPPLAEQQRIVAKVDELMALCDQLEAAQAERESRRDRLAASSLNRLNNGANPDAFRDHARFYFNHLPRLTTRPEHIQQLRQAILNLAIRGKLVPQDLDDRPVRVIDRKGIPLSTDYSDHDFNESQSALNLPSSWGIEPLARVAAAIVDCPHSTPKWADKGRICVRTNQFRPGYLDLSESRYVSEETYMDRIQRLEPTHNDILYSREGGILGVACRIPADVKLCLGQRMMLIRAGEATTAQFLEMVLNSPFITTIARTRTTGGAAPRVNVATIRAYPIPLPPLAEQQHIVAKVDELMALCDRLEAQLTTTQTESRRLLEAVLHEALTETNRQELADMSCR